MIDFRYLYNGALAFVMSATLLAMEAGTYFHSALLWFLALPCLVVSIYMLHLMGTHKWLSL